MKIKTYIVDAFTDKAFKGNPAGVCLLENPVEVELMQSIATELNLSETAFLTKTEEEKFNIRYFTPTVEIAFCGHATLASAKVLLSKYQHKKIEFTTFHQLKLSVEPEEKGIKMIFPLYETVPYDVPPELLKAFKIENPLTLAWSKELAMLLVEIESKDDLLNLNPDFEKAIQSSHEVKEVVVTTKSNDADYDFYSRCFCPWIGINEDPVTGAAHSVLAKFWQQKFKKNEFNAYQLSKRGGYLKLNIINENSLEVRSNAVIILNGEIEI